MKIFFLIGAFVLTCLSNAVFAQQESLTIPDSATTFLRSDFKASSGYPAFIINGKAANFDDMFNYTASSEEATSYIKKAKTAHVLTFISGFAAIGFTTWGILDYYKNSELNPAITSAAVVTLASTFIFQYSFKNNANKAIYELHPELKEDTHPPTIGVVLQPNALGIALRF